MRIRKLTLAIVGVAAVALGYILHGLHRGARIVPQSDPVSETATPMPDQDITPHASPPRGGGGGAAIRRPIDASGAEEATPSSETLDSLESAMNAQDFARALDIAERMMHRPAEGVEREEIALVRARLLSSVGRERDAFDALDSILSDATDNEILHQAAARYFIVARNEGILDEAINRQESRVARKPHDPATLRIMAQFYEYAQDAESELRILKSLQRVDASAENLARIAKLQRALNNIEGASATTAEIAESMHPDAAAHLLLKQAQAEIAAERGDLAGQTARIGLALPGVHPSMAFRFAHALKDAGDDGAAIEAFRNIAETEENVEIRDRSALEGCRIRVESGERTHDLLQLLNALQQSPVTYVQEQAAILLKEIR